MTVATDRGNDKKQNGYNRSFSALPRLLESELEYQEENALSDATPPPSLIPFNLGFFLVVASHGVISSFGPLYFQQIGFNPGVIGIVMLCRPLGGFVGGLLVPIISQWLGSEEKVAVLFSILLLISTFSIGYLGPMDFSANKDCSPQDAISMPGINREYELKSFSNRDWMYDTDALSQLVLVSGFLIFFSDFFLVGLDSILHSVTMRALGKENTKSFGTVRAWGCLGYAASAASTGLVVETSSSEKKLCTQLFRSSDYHLMFYTFLVFAMGNVLNVGNIFTASKFGESSHYQKAMSHKDLGRALCTFKNISWMVVLVCRSVFFSVTHGVLNWHLANLGASPLLIGCANCVKTVTEFFMFFATPKLIEVFGHRKLVQMGLFSYMCRFIIFSKISNPVVILPVQLLEGVMFACTWSALVSHLSNQVPPEGETQLQGLIQALYMLGTGISFPMSGMLTQLFGASVMFLIFAVLAGLTFFVFTLAQLSWFCGEDKRDQAK